MSAQTARTCAYVRQDGTRCPGLVEGEGTLCFWHDPAISKDQEGVKERLQEWAARGESMEGFVLRYANLEGIRLSSVPNVDLRRSILFRARLQGASLWNVDLREADLMKADLSGANLNEAKLQKANLLGTVLEGTKLERVEWGEIILQEGQARAAEQEGDHRRARENYIEAEEVYRSLRRACEGAGRFVEAGEFFRREMIMRRKLMSKWSVGRFWSKLVDLFCGYGEDPQRVIGFSLLLILGCAAIYFGAGVKGPEGRIGFSAAASLGDNLRCLFNCIYYSIITFTTTGYGDVHPLGGITRTIASIEAFSGAFMTALFVAVFGKKMTRA